MSFTIGICFFLLSVFFLYKAFVKSKNQNYFANVISKANSSNLTEVGFAAIWSINAGKKCKHPSHHIDMETFKARCSHCGELDT